MSDKPKPEPKPLSLERSGSAASLELLQAAASEHIIEMDKLMKKGPASYERGVAVARLASKLQDAVLESKMPPNQPIPT